MKLPIAALAALATILPAAARDNGQWADQPAAIRQWFQSLMQPDNPAVSCCGEADAFEADTFEVEGDHYVAIITDGKGILPAGTRIPVPNSEDEVGCRQSDRARHRLHRRGRPALLLRRARRRLNRRGACPAQPIPHTSKR